MAMCSYGLYVLAVEILGAVATLLYGVNLVWDPIHEDPEPDPTDPGLPLVRCLLLWRFKVCACACGACALSGAVVAMWCRHAVLNELMHVPRVRGRGVMCMCAFVCLCVCACLRLDYSSSSRSHTIFAVYPATMICPVPTLESLLVLQAFCMDLAHPLWEAAACKLGW